MKLTAKQHKNIIAMQKLERDFRGTYLSNCAWIESMLADAICRYFCTDETKRNLLFSEVFTGSGLQFRAKIMLFKSIIASVDSALLNQYEPIIDLMQNKVRFFRNRIAHCHLDSNIKAVEEFDGKRIAIVFYEDGEKKNQFLSYDYMKTKNGELEEVKKGLLKFLNEAN